MKFLGIIPARYASTRFPAKPLAMLGGKTVIQRVYEQVAGVLDDAYVATDDERIEAAVKVFGGKVVMTSVHHKSGTDRCYEAMVKIGQGFDVIVNIQGDEPFIQPSQLHAIKACFDDAATQIATLVKPFSADAPLGLWKMPTPRKWWSVPIGMPCISAVPSYPTCVVWINRNGFAAILSTSISDFTLTVRKY